ncbi:hypothetical protein HanXRQr2_Chr16g0723291 [Helianthus annuus]|uniref:Uncharacterized protein n=1 Tax=Helianthus annuus TaxID=4232 RepID=A0A9K3DNH7_HELAN|nr:hypothetical protein HanXRQr2_Chr16g0723291 [Helianthus annuus]KAJ0819234.1 hypothetical protein HanPSC8_Chr16g0693771 [Helianthus annuus]
MCLDRPYLRFHGFFTKDKLLQLANPTTNLLSDSQVQDLQNPLLQNRALDGVIWVLRRCFQHRLNVHWFKIKSY